MDTECAICFEKIKNAICPRGCKHAFHSECLKKWFSTNTTCPLCRFDCGGLSVPKERAYTALSYKVGSETLYFHSRKEAIHKLKFLARISFIYKVLNSQLSFRYGDNGKIKMKPTATLKMWKRAYPNEELPTRKHAKDVAFAIAHRHRFLPFYRESSTLRVRRVSLAQSDLALFQHILCHYGRRVAQKHFKGATDTRSIQALFSG